MSLYGSVGASSVRSGSGPHPLAAPSGLAPTRKRKDRDDDRPYPDPDAPPTYSSSSSSNSSSLLGLPRPPPHVRQPLPPPSAERRLGLGYSSHPTALVGKQHPGPTSPPLAKPGGNRVLVAGYLAHEFLSRGTIFGRPHGTAVAAQAPRKEELQRKRLKQYLEFAGILWGGGAHVPGVVNPSQLGGWLQKLQEE